MPPHLQFLVCKLQGKITELNTVFKSYTMILTVKAELVYYVKQDQDDFDWQHKH